MGQVGIVRIGEEFYREYAVEPDDYLIRICLRYGHTDWSAVYENPVNQAFQDRFPDPDDIDYVNPVNLFVPLAGAVTSGKSRRGTPIGDFHIAKIKWEDGTPFAGEELVLLGPGLPSTGTTITTSARGDVILANPEPGTWSLVSPTVSLRPTATTGTIAPRELVLPGPTPVASDPTPLTRNAVDTLTARSVVGLRCPMCWSIFAVTAQNPAGTGYICPHDAANWATIIGALILEPSTFLSSPSPPQNPSLTPDTLICRGEETSPLGTVYGPLRVFWDESRFVDPAGASYSLWGSNAAGVVSADIVGRGTWGAAMPHVGGGREYKFHATLTGASVIYTFPIPSNESSPLTTVLKWMTVHHTTDPPLNSMATAVAVQNKHFTDIGGTGPGADIGYHFIVDGDGTVYEARPLGIKGSHAEQFNGGNVGIVLAGNFEYIRDPTETIILFDPPNTPTAAQLSALFNMVDVLAARFGIRSAWSHNERKNQAAAGHTFCPGITLLPFLPPMRAKYFGPPP